LLFSTLLSGCAANRPITIQKKPIIIDDIYDHIVAAQNEVSLEIPNGTRLAVLEINYHDQFIVTEITELLRELTLKMRKAKGFRLVETEEYTLEKLKGILDIEMSGYVNDEEAARIGHWLGVDVIILGEISSSDNYNILRIWAVEVESRERIAISRKQL
jgi:hypothetical protein